MQRPMQLIAIDPQNDFCDLPESWCAPDPLTHQRLAPALPVAGAHADLQRLAGLIRAGGDRWDSITITLDSHHRVDIAHPPFWQRADGGEVAPFTPITARQVRAGEFLPRLAKTRPEVLPRTLAYLDELQAQGRYTLMVWPVHCAMGSWGHNVHADVGAAVDAWAERTLNTVRFVPKGMNPWTEHYSALQAEVPDPDDPETQLNRPLLRALDSASTLLIAGQASSHCVHATTEHLLQHLPGGRPERLVLVTDCMSPVRGFEAPARAFLERVRAQGVRLATSTELIAELSASAERGQQGAA